MASAGSKKEVRVDIRPRTSSSDSSAAPSLKAPRPARFAEATSVDSPVEATPGRKFPFTAEHTSHYKPQPQVSDVGFGYLGAPSGHDADTSGVEMPATPRSPLKSALKSPGAAPRRFDNPLSPTFQEEDDLELAEKATEKEQAKDLKTKVRVRMAKMVLRFTNFSCSLIVLSMLSTTFSIFNATKALPPRNSLPAWSQSTVKWPQITLLVIACISLFFSLVVFYAYWRGGHKKAEKVAIYYTTFAIGFFLFSIIMWAVGAAILQGGRNHSNGQDIWGWSCKNNPRKQFFESDVSYDLVCRLQNWSLVCCIIEVVVEVITISIYGITFYRYWSKRRLRKSMFKRDTARSDLYLAQLRSQSQPNTPAPFTPRDGGYNPMFSPRFAQMNEEKQPSVGVAEQTDANGVRYIDASQKSPQKPFVLKAPPTKAGGTPRMSNEATFGAGSVPHMPTVVPPSPGPLSPAMHADPVHQPAAPGEQQYAAVPIPGAYSSPLQSPTYGHAGQSYFAPMR